MEKRLVLAIAISILIVIGFQYMAPRPVTTSVPATVDGAKPDTVVKVAEILPSHFAKPEERELEKETDRYKITFSNAGGAIKNIVLKNFKVSRSDDLLVLSSLTTPSEYLFAISSNTDPDIAAAEYFASVSNGTIIYTCQTGSLHITKTYTLRDAKYGIWLDLVVKNTSGSSRRFAYNLVAGAGLKEIAAADKGLIEVTSSIDGKPVGFKRPKTGQRIINPGIVNWTALKNKYFSFVLKPYINTRDQCYYDDGHNNLVMSVNSDEVTIDPGVSVNSKFLLYAGPSSISSLKEFDSGLEASVNYGFFGGISKVMIALMGFFHLITRSWGFSIILLAVLINLITFPLTIKSFKSMQKMQELHPQMEQLKKQYKSSPEKLNKAVMELYKKYKINPLSGCLPIVLQMPIFIALYAALMRSIELRNASFFWIRDLSLPDAVPLPFTLPFLGNSLNVLPLIMIAAMVMQQKISTKTMGSAVTAEQKEQQKIMLIVMPVVFGLIFYNMPSGLVLYWVINTLLTVGEQWSMTKNA